MNSLRSHAYLPHLMTAFGKSIMIIGTLCLIMLFPAHSAGQQATLTDDAQTSAGAPNQNFGANASVRVSGTNIRGFFKFKLTPNLPADTTGSRVGKATLKLFVGSVTTPGTLEVFRVTGAWEEATVTGATAPPTGNMESAITVDDTQVSKWVTLDVTQLVKDWLDGVLPNEGIVLVANGGVGNVLFNSKENQTTSHEARLEVVLNHAATADRATEADNATNAATANSLSSTAVVPGSQISGDIAGRASSITGTVNGSQVSGAVAETTHAASADNANTVTNGVYTIGDQTIEGLKTFSSGVNSTSHYSIGGNRVLTVDRLSSVYVGLRAGHNATGGENSFLGSDAGESNTTGSQNSLFGVNAGKANVTGGNNSFFGAYAGLKNTSHDNSFFGSHSGVVNTTGRHNSFFGFLAGLSNTIGNQNSFLGYVAGGSNTTGSMNSFFGTAAGTYNTEGSNNTFVGANAGLYSTSNNNTFIGANTSGAPGITNATALGADAQVTSSNTMVLGTSAVNVQVPGNLNVSGSVTGNFTGTVSANSLSGVVSVSNGGTGLNSSGTAGSFLRSNGSSWTSAQLTETDVPAGSANYIQNSTTQQAGASLNISGSGTFGTGLMGNVVNTATQYNIAGQRVLSTPGMGTDIYVGINAGNANASVSANNSFFGFNAGPSNTTGNGNSFFGTAVGFSNTTGFSNSFYGAGAGNTNTSGAANSFFGNGAGAHNTEANNNSFFGASAGFNNTTGFENSSFGIGAGFNNTTGSNNTFVGRFAGFSNTAENNNTFIGADSNGAPGITNATAVGSHAQVTQSNSLVLGSISGVNNTAAGTNVGIGTTAPSQRLEVVGNVKISGAGNSLIFPDGTTMTTAPPASSATASDLNCAGCVSESELSFDPTTQVELDTHKTSSDHDARYSALSHTHNVSEVANAATLGSNNFTGNQSINGDLSAVHLNAGTVTSNTFYKIGGSIVLRATDVNTSLGMGAGVETGGNSNSFFGGFAGSSNTLGGHNSFFGTRAGQANTVGFSNAFFGTDSGSRNTTGTNNAFFGDASGISSTEGHDNSFFGSSAGAFNTTGGQNSFFGRNAGINSSGSSSSNSFFGYNAGRNHGTGNDNTYVGANAGQHVVGGDNNTFIGARATGVMTGISNATAIGANAFVSRSDSLVLGSSNISVGIGTTAPQTKLHVEGGNILVGSAGQGIILKSPSGVICRLLSIDEAGAIVLTPISCP